MVAVAGAPTMACSSTGIGEEPPSLGVVAGEALVGVAFPLEDTVAAAVTVQEAERDAPAVELLLAAIGPALEQPAKGLKGLPSGSSSLHSPPFEPSSLIPMLL